jgi:transposase
MGVIIGMDPHKRSATIEVVDDRARVLAVGRFGTDTAGYADMLASGRRYPDRVWAVEGCNGIGKHIAHRLVHDGEVVLDVPAKLSAQVRVFATGNGRKTDPVDAHSVAMVALRTPNLVPVQVDADLQVLGMLADRRDELGRARTQTINRLHRLLLELLPGGAKQFLSDRQARALIATIKPRDTVGKTRRRLTVELIGELESIDKKIKAAEKDLKELVAARGSTLMELHGIGPSGAARLLADVGDIRRSPTGTGSPPGTAPPRWTPPPESRNATACPVPVTGASTGRCTSWPSSSYATAPSAVPTSTPRKRLGRPRWRPCARSNGDCPTWSTPGWSPTRHDGWWRTREGTRGRLCYPA